MSTLSQLYEKSVKKVTGVYIQTKQNSLKFLSALNINIANKPNENTENTEIEHKSKNNDLEIYNKESKSLDSKPAFFNPLTPYQIESYHNFISDASDAPPYYNHSTDYYYNTDYDVSNINSPNSAYSTNSFSYQNFDYSRFRNPYLRESPCSVNEKDLSDQESSDDQDDYFSRKRSNYSSHSSSSSVSSTNFGINDLALTPLSNDKNDEGYEIIGDDDIKYIEREKAKEKKSKRRKSTLKSISSQKSDRSIRSMKPRKSISKLSLRLNKKKSTSSTTTTDTAGTTNFEEFISSLDISEDIEDKLQWLFRFYDHDGDGFITRDEMLQIMHTLYN